MLIQRKCLLTLLSVLIVAVIASSSMVSSGASTQKIIVQNIELSPKVANIGENVRVKANIRNTGKNSTTFNVKAFVGASAVEEFKDVTISPQDTFSLMFTVNTSSLSEGKYPVEILVEESAIEQQKVFDLGTIAVGQENSELENSAGLNMLYMLPVVPIVAVVCFVVWKRRRNTSQEDKMPKDLLPNLLNEVLNFEEKVDAGVAETKNSSNDKGYVC